MFKITKMFVLLALFATSGLAQVGMIHGIITEIPSGNPINGARIGVVDRPWDFVTGPDGFYIMEIPADSQWVIKVESPPLCFPVWDTVIVSQNDTLIQNYALEHAIPVILKASFHNPIDASYRSFYIEGSWDSVGVYDSIWSGPYIEIKDDGIAPDQNSHDGIFSGQAWLHPNSHIFGWAIHTENYGGDDSKLQNGANFSMPSYTPPIVPTLIVNPSGHDNNWGLSVCGTPDLNVDLFRGVNGNPYMWGAATALDSGVTYSFKFCVMHSEVASYPIGGPHIIFNCDYSGNYNFIYNESDQSYIVEITGTEGPPVMLSARSGLDGHIPLVWYPPGTTISQEMAYDDGILANAYYFNNDDLIAELFCPSSPGGVIDSVMVHLLTDGDLYWPWPDNDHDPVGVFIFLDDGTGLPELDPVYYAEAICQSGKWLRVNVPEVEFLGNFWIAVNNLAGGGQDAIGLDAATDYPSNKWCRINGQWQLNDQFAGDHMIRTKVFNPNRSEWIGSDNSPETSILLGVTTADNLTEARGTGNPTAPKPASAGISLNRVAYHPRMSPGDSNEIFDTQHWGYFVYRDTVPRPYDRRPATLVNFPDFPLMESNYDDWCRYNQTDSLQNGVLYYYQASALYHMDNDRHFEVGPSNQTTAIPQNHAPANPRGLSGYSDGNDVNLEWRPNNDYDIAGYKIYRRDYNSNEYNLVGTVEHPTSTFLDIVIENGIYGYKIAAIDKEGMQSEGYSNSILIPIGSFPPNNVRATDDEESQITVNWSSPGSINDDINILVVASDNATFLIDTLSFFPNVDNIDYFNASNVIPTLEQLADYNVVVAWSNYTFQDPIQLGNILADYIDLGGSVILNQFCFSDGWGLGGRIVQEYSPFAYGNTFYQNACLGAYDTLSPIMNGVTQICDIYHAGVELVNDGQLIASWDSGDPLVAVNPQHAIVCINGYVGDDRQFTGDMIRLEYNAINYVAGYGGVIPQQYKVYKSDNPEGPFTLLAILPGISRHYVDRPVPNGVDLYYRLTSIFPGYDESPLSEFAVGRAINLPPSAPYNLVGNVDYRDVSLRWSFVNIAGDWNHFNIYKRPLFDGEYTLTGIVTDTSSVINIPAGEDGLWYFAVTAVDNGTPPLESEYSNLVLVEVGIPPPTNLRATSGQDGIVPLQWNAPGLRPRRTIRYDDRTPTDSHPWVSEYDNLIANQFEVLNGAVIETLSVHVLTMGDPYWPRPDSGPDSIAVSIFDDNGSGLPGDRVFYRVTIGELGHDIVVPIENRLELTGPNFWVAVNNITGGGNDGISLDAVTDYPQYKWQFENGVWSHESITTGDLMIRATVADLDLETRFNYFIYRDVAPNIPLDPEHRIIELLQSPPIWNDSTVTNGITYYYKITAAYPNGNDFVESPGSNESSATPLRHPCRYVYGDINSDSTFNGLDVIFMVSYFKGRQIPDYSCNCPPGHFWYVAGDVNASCSFNGIDVTYSVAYFKGGPAPVPCPDCPPEE